MSRKLARRTGATGVFGAAALSLLLTHSVTSAQAGALSSPQSLSVGRTFNDGLTTALGAQRMANAFANTGYASHAYTSGTSAATVFTEGQGAYASFLFMHANAGFMATHEDQYLIADDLNTVYGPTTGTPVGDPRFSKLSSYLEFVDVDDMKLFIFAGCYTDQTSTSFGHLPTVARNKGIDATVSYPGLIYGAHSSAANKDYSGNYYWGRAAYYLENGYTILSALSKARTDLVTKEGNAGGWDTYRIRGAVPSPSNVRITPNSPGHEYDSSVAGVQPLTLVPAPAVTQQRTESIAGVGYIDLLTADGYSIRRLAETGEIVGLDAPAATAGSETMDEDDALAAAHQFLAENVAAYGPDYVLTHRGPVSHVEGDAVSLFEWRTVVNGVAGPRRIQVELDRRTGATTYLAVTRAAAGAASAPTISADTAIAAVRALTGPAGSATAVSDVWDRARWTVTVDRGIGGHLWRDAEQFVVDGHTGEVVARSTT